MHAFVLNPKLPVTVYYIGKHVSRVFEDLRKMKAPNTHVGMKNLHKLLKGEHVLGLTNVHFDKDRICSACQAGKQVGVHHPHKNIMTTDRPLELLHMDLFGPIAYISIGGSKYYLVIVDDYSRFTWVFFLQEKSQTLETLKRFLRRAQNEFGLRIKKIRSDNGTEFKNS
jgi:transposase InsO family protein